jgi:hypothetical protein
VVRGVPNLFWLCNCLGREPGTALQKSPHWSEGFWPLKTGRLAEDGVIPDIYPLKELPMAGYRQRTKKNVIDSDGTLIIYFGFPTGGTELDIRGSILRRERPKSRLKGKPLFRYDYWAPIAQSGSPKERPRDKSADPGRNCPLLCSGRVPLHFILNCSPYLILQAASDQVRVNGRFHTPQAPRAMWWLRRATARPYLRTWAPPPMMA